MNRSRLAAVRTSIKGKHNRISSGCVIAPRLVLTAGHALQPQTAAMSVAHVRVQVQLFTGRQLAPADIVWDGRPAGLDAAVLRVEPGRWPDDIADSSVRFGQFVTLRAGQDADALGFARVQGARRPDGLETAQVSGTVSPGDGMLGEHWELTVDRAPAALGTSPWSGMSGAALWSGPLVCGVVTVDLAHWNHGKLQVVPAHRLLRQEELRELLRQELGYVPVAEAVELEALCEPAVPSRSPRLPSELLRPQAEAVPFTGREHELGEFREWCAEGGGLATRLITGRGGQGKSRFARELSVTMATRGWVTAQLRESDAERAELVKGLQALTAVDQRMLLVMDYAETSPELVGNVLETLKARGGHHSVRMVLIARSAGEWWEQLPGATRHSAGVLSGARTVELHDVATTSAERARMYRAAVRALARRLPDLRELTEYARVDWGAVARAVLAWSYRDTCNGSALDLHMRALLDLLTAADRQVAGRAQPREERGAQARVELDVQAQLLGHEQRYWKRTAGSWPKLDGLDQDVLADAVAVATLTRAADPERATELLSLVPGLAQERVAAAAEWLHELYPPVESSYWGALEPDLLGEYHVALRIRDNNDLLTGLLPHLRGREAERALTVLARATAQAGCPCPDLDRKVERLIVAHPAALAVPAAVVAGRSENPGFLLDALRLLTARRDLPLDLLENLHAAVPDRSRLLGEQALELARQLVKAHRHRARLARGVPAFAPAHIRAGLARAEHNYAVRLSSVRRWADVVESSRRAVRLYRALARSDPAAYLPLLADSLGVRWAALSELRRYREALADCAEAVQVNRQLVAGEPATPGATTPTSTVAHRARLGQALNNLSVVLAERDLPQEARAVSEEAVEILEELVRDRPTRHHLALLAGALHNRANRLSPGPPAVEAVTQAVRIRRRLAQAYPDAYLPALVESLHNQALELGELDQTQEAGLVLDECLRVTLQLVEDQPTIYRPTLARVLRTRAQVLGRRGRHVEAVRCAVTATLLYRQLATTQREFASAVGPLLSEIADLALFAGAGVDVWRTLTREAHALARTRRRRAERKELRRTRWPRWRAHLRARSKQAAGIRIKPRVRVLPLRRKQDNKPRDPRFTLGLSIPKAPYVPDVHELELDQQAFRKILLNHDLVKLDLVPAEVRELLAGAEYNLKVMADELNAELESLMERFDQRDESL
ncbi:serine protease [Streptomyces sp. NL15-2K]|uniref:S1 family peptidase n=1 Tax=Streptomyces sp. NL15-2K TaxID=376149 RepID=UPI000F582946|nr:MULTISPECIES: serine protease [Actinomycetes]WKX12736.1 serine protease [Kutzneria buriramensis]GCB45917.1 tetratricopeptide repeat family [Streptomyces sp. NL15-2K]